MYEWLKRSNIALNEINGYRVSHATCDHSVTTHLTQVNSEHHALTPAR